MASWAYSARSAAMGSSREARLAGYTPAVMPTRMPSNTPTPTNTHTPAPTKTPVPTRIPSRIVIPVPTPNSPQGITTDHMPTYRWTKVGGATQYRFELVRGTAVVYTRTVASSVCGPASCANRPLTNPLSDGAYRWRVQAGVNGTWGAFSAFKSFTIFGSQ